MGHLLKELRIGSLDWKGVLLAGIGPSLIYTVGLIFCLKGPSGITSTLVAAYGNFPRFAAGSTTLLAATLVAAFLLYALRSVILQIHRRIPIPGLYQLMLKWSVWRRARAEKERWIALWQIDVAQWVDSGFKPDPFAVQVVLDAKGSLDEARTIAESAALRGWIAAGDAEWSRHSKYAFRTFEKLHILAVRRTQVTTRAAELAQLGNRSDAQNWSEAERVLGMTAPSDALMAELGLWRDLQRDSARILDRLKSFDNYRLYDHYRECARKRAKFPNTVWMEPTKLGNIFAALEDYAAERYGMDTLQLWSRLEIVVPKSQREQIASYQIALGSLLNTNLALLALALSATVIGIQAEDWREGVFAAFAVAAAYCCKSAALYAASGVREKIEAAVDLNVLRWLRSLGVVPVDAASRLTALRQLGVFFNGGTPLPQDFKFVALAEPGFEDKKKDKD